MTEPLRASSIMFGLYKELIQKFNANPLYRGFEGRRNPSKGDYPDIAGNLYHWFSPHYYKVLDMVSKHDTQYKSTFTSIEKQKYITIIDIGAGVGTFTLTVCDYLYQRRKNNEDLPKHKVKAILIEPNNKYHSIAKCFIKMQPKV